MCVYYSLLAKIDFDTPERFLQSLCITRYFVIDCSPSLEPDQLRSRSAEPPVQKLFQGLLERDIPQKVPELENKRRDEMER